LPSSARSKVTRRKTVKSKSSRDKVSAHRKRLRAQGLRPIQIWVPDTRSPRFIKQARQQSRAVASSAHAGEDQAFIASLGELDFE